MTTVVFTDIAAPPFSPRPNVKPRKDKDFTDEFVVLDFLGRFVFVFQRAVQTDNIDITFTIVSILEISTTLHFVCSFDAEADVDAVLLMVTAAVNTTCYWFWRWVQT
jgi:hypothetical protein